MAKKMEFYEGEEQQKRVGSVMRALVSTSKVPKPAPQARPQSSAK